MTPELREAVFERGGLRCRKAFSYQCQRLTTDLHHMIPKSRGGRLADDQLAAEIANGMMPEQAAFLAFHLVGLCHPCHMAAHSEGHAAAFYPGTFRTEPSGQVIYRGDLQGVPPYWFQMS